MRTTLICLGALGLFVTLGLAFFTGLVGGLGDNAQATSDFQTYTLVTGITSIVCLIVGFRVNRSSTRKE